MEYSEKEVFFEGFEVGSVTVKWVRRTKAGKCFMGMVRHEGNPSEKIKEIFNKYSTDAKNKMAVTGQAAKALLNLPYRTETECFEKALEFKNLKPDIILSLGGENFCIYTLKNGKIRKIIPSPKCGAGTGEFIVQQFQRMDLTLESGILESYKGKVVELATRCSVYCKSDATHKLNKRECTRADIAKSLINDLASKVNKMVELAKWKTEKILVTGGISLNKPFIECLRKLLPNSEISVIEESPCFESFGAALLASELSDEEAVLYKDITFNENESPYEILKPLVEFEDLLDYRVKDDYNKGVIEKESYILGVDAGSTTTKVVLFNYQRETIDAGCYLRTHGNPISAVKNCIQNLIEQIGDKEINIIQIAVTGSGRGIVSVFLENCPNFNEILAHARAAVEEINDVDTVFEIGGQDSKFISFLNGIPIDYAMNEGCSAGTGSFLEESVSVDMGIPVQEISNRAISSRIPIAFGERCAAFINTDIRNALQQGTHQEDVIAGLAYSIARNYVSRIVGDRVLGERLLFQGGVALNKSVALAMAAVTKRKIIVPQYPELMGCFGSSLMIKDMLKDGRISPKSYDLNQLANGTMEVKGTFQCKGCENVCEIKRIEVRKKEYPFGGLCSKYDTKHQLGQAKKEGQNFIEIRDKLMFEKYGAKTLQNSRGTIGIPLALSTYEFYPFYAKLANELGFNVVLSTISKEGNNKTKGPICYPSEIAHGAVYDLLKKHVDYIFIPHIIDGGDAEKHIHSYICANAASIPDLVREAFNIDKHKLLDPNIGFSKELRKTTLLQISKLGEKLGISKKAAFQAGEHAFEYYQKFIEEFNQIKKDKFKTIISNPTVVLAGRPYVICSSEVNLALPRKIVSRGYNVISADMLPELNDMESENIFKTNAWHFTQQITKAIAYAKKYSNIYICLVSCFSCIPDSSMQHIYRSELAGEAFCYLEIDSHTAHAGFETRVGAFLDILELNEQKVF